MIDELNGNGHSYLEASMNSIHSNKGYLENC